MKCHICETNEATKDRDGLDYCLSCLDALEISMLKQQLAAAQAELAAEKLSNQIDAACAEQFQDAMHRAEQAEKRVAELEGQVKQLHYCLIKDGEYIGEYQAKNKRMRDALEEIKDMTTYAWTDYNECFFDAQNIAKAALEEKP